MSSTAKRFPKLCRHKASNRAFVTIDGRDVYLGPYGSDEAQRYDRIIAEWLERGRQSSGDEALATVRADRAIAAVKVISQSPPLSVNEVCLPTSNGPQRRALIDAGPTNVEITRAQDTSM